MPLIVVEGSKRRGETFISTYIGEICSECGEARMLHPQIYVYTCPYCRYSFMVEPCSSPFQRGIVILHKSEVKKH